VETVEGVLTKAAAPHVQVAIKGVGEQVAIKGVGERDWLVLELCQKMYGEKDKS
jgi:hypothetical protein